MPEYRNQLFLGSVLVLWISVSVQGAKWTDTISEIASMTKAEMISEAPNLSSAIRTRLRVELAGLWNHQIRL